MPATGDILEQKYRLVRQIGNGAMGAVWLAEHVSLKSRVAIKLLARNVAETPGGLKRFMREARLAASLRSRHIVQTLDQGVHGEAPYIVMEFLDGESLEERLRRVGRLDVWETERVIRQVATALGRAHDVGIIHRDVKPANIFVAHEDDEDVFKLLDFGIAKSIDGLSSSLASGTQTGSFVGTPLYASPEQAQGAKHIDARTDVWSLGVVAFECLVGRPPFAEETLGRLVLAICMRPLPVPSQHGPTPVGFDGWFELACARDLENRFQSATAAARAFTNMLLQGLTHPAQPMDANAPVQPPPAQNVGLQRPPGPGPELAPVWPALAWDASSVPAGLSKSHSILAERIRLPLFSLVQPRRLVIDALGRFPVLQSRKAALLAGALALLAIFGVWMCGAVPGTLRIVISPLHGALPSDLNLSVDGTQRCSRAPCVVELTAGHHEILVTAADRISERASVDIVGGEIVTRTFRLRPAPDNADQPQASEAPPVAGVGTGAPPQGAAYGHLHVLGKGFLAIDGNDVGALPRELRDLRSGEHVIRIDSSPDYWPLEQTVMVEAGSVTTIGPFVLQVRVGWVDIVAGTGAEGAVVTLQVGEQPERQLVLPARFKVDTWNTTMVFAQKEGFKTFVRRIDFDGGQSQKTISVTLEENAR